MEPAPPLPHSYWVEPGRLLAGEYPAGDTEDETRQRIGRLLDAGIDCFFDLTEPGELDPYEAFLPGPYARRPVIYLRRPIRDHGLPDSEAHMEQILDELDAALAEGRRIYLHCRAGIGRTNLVAGCWFAAAGAGGESALHRLNERWRTGARSRSWPGVPETDEQSDYVRRWRARRSPANAPAGGAGPAGDPRDRCRGLLLGLAAGDALGQPVRGRRAGTFPEPVEPAGGGPLKLPPGAWSDKTAMALCLSDSLVRCGGIDAQDQVRRYREWQRDGRWSSTGTAAGLSDSTASALANAQWSGIPWSGSHDPARAEAEPLARIGPAVVWHRADPATALEAAVGCARVTHQAPLVLDAVRYLAALLVGALAGASREALLAPLFSPVPGLWERAPLRPRVLEVAQGAWRERRPGGTAPPEHAVAAALAAALWAFAQGGDLRSCLQAAAGLGGDADTIGAITGQLAGAHFGASALPAGWRARLARAAEIEMMADALAARRAPGAFA